jgi:DNA-binding MarR family transcriptional regulator
MRPDLTTSNARPSRSTGTHVGQPEPIDSSTTPRVQQFDQLLSHAQWYVARELARVLRAEGCTVDQWRTLALLADQSSHSMSEIAEFAMLPAPTLTRLIDRMVADNLLYRRADPRDRRRVLVQISDRGRLLHEHLAERVEGDRDLIVGDADPQDIANLVDLLAGLAERLR